MKWTIALYALAGCLLQAQAPPAKKLPLLSPKAATLATGAKHVALTETRISAFPAPTAGFGIPYYFVNHSKPFAPQIFGVVENSIVLIAPEETPRLLIPNPAQSTFTKLESSSNLVDWVTLGYFTNFTWDFYIADVAATNKPHNFYRLVPVPSTP